MVTRLRCRNEIKRVFIFRQMTIWAVIWKHRISMLLPLVSRTCGEKALFYRGKKKKFRRVFSFVGFRCSVFQLLHLFTILFITDTVCLYLSCKTMNYQENCGLCMYMTERMSFVFIWPNEWALWLSDRTNELSIYLTERMSFVFIWPNEWVLCFIWPNE